MAKRHRPTGNCPTCHRHDVRYVVTLADGSVEMACGACAAHLGERQGALVESVA